MNSRLGISHFSYEITLNCVRSVSYDGCSDSDYPLSLWERARVRVNKPSTKDVGSLVSLFINVLNSCLRRFKEGLSTRRVHSSFERNRFGRKQRRCIIHDKRVSARLIRIDLAAYRRVQCIYGHLAYFLTSRQAHEAVQVKVIARTFLNQVCLIFKTPSALR